MPWLSSTTSEFQVTTVAPPTLPVVAGFALLFAVSLRRGVGLDAALAAAQAQQLRAIAPAQQAAYQALRGATELHVLGSAFVAAGRFTHVSMGQFTLTAPPDASPTQPDTPQPPLLADVHLFLHVSGAALWEVWLPGEAQSFDPQAWVAWLDEQAPHSLASQVWQALQALNLRLGGQADYKQYLPCSIIRLTRHSVDDLLAQHAADVVGLLWRDQLMRALKPDVVAQELARDYCARAGGITLLGRRSALDIHDSSDESALEATRSGLPPRSAVPFLVTLELLLIERAVLLQLYAQLSEAAPTRVEALLQLKQEVTDGLEEYYGATLAATRFGDAVAEDGERLLGIVELYDALMDRLETVSFSLTTRYQQRMTLMQFWLTVVFGATEIGFIAASIATWYYSHDLVAVLAWTLGATAVAAAVLVGLLRTRVDTLT